MSAEAASGNLAKIEHVVVLMLENRSFDHMLGYLSLEGGRSDIDGLREGMANSYAKRDYPIHRLEETKVPSEKWDPNHSALATDHQINGGAMDGFVASYEETLAGRGVTDLDPQSTVMGYFGAEQVPVYDHLAAHFCVCDAWHSSVPGATWPNRLYAVAGQADGSRDDRPHHEPPIYDKPSFIRHLDAAGVDWRWYSYDIGSLRAVDVAEYGLGHHEHFRWVDRLKLGIKTKAEELPFIDEDAPSFIEEARAGTLPAFSWIDPNFKDMNLVGSPSNDDHPPSDVKDGQELVFLVYNALASGPLWDKTLLLVVYDEHGGFHDHVPPPEAPDDDPKEFGRYGIRVPALVVSPWVEPASVGKELFDHTSIIKTVLERFCPTELDERSDAGEVIHWLEEGHPHYMGKRVASANGLGGLLTRSEPRRAPNRRALAEWVAHRHAGRARALHEAAVAGGKEVGLSDLQQGIVLLEADRHKAGHPPGQP